MVAAATVVAVICVVRLNGRPANRASVVLLQPQDDAILVKPVLARQNDGLITDGHVFDTDGALRLAFAPEHFPIDRLSLQGPEGFLRGWRRGVGLGVCIHQLRDNAIERLL